MGIIVVAASEGIEETVHTLKQFIGESFDVNGDKLLIVSGYATKPREVKDNPELVEEAQGLGRQIMDNLIRGV